MITETDLEEDENGAHPLIQLAESMKQDAGELRGTLWVGKASAQPDKMVWENRHWQVMDDQAYRLEHGMKRGEAHVNFGRPDVASDLAKLFEDVRENAEQTNYVSAT